MTTYGCPLDSNENEITMGLTFLEVEVGNPANPEVTEKVKFLIDSGIGKNWVTH